MWVHPGCIPCYWDQGLDVHGNRLTHPRLRPIPTEWGVKVYGEWEEWVGGDENWELMGVPYYCMVKGYPKEKLMFDRIVHAVKRFQAIWRGYLYKKAYPLALSAAKATEAINLNARATMSSKQAKPENSASEEENTALAYHKVWHSKRDSTECQYCKADANVRSRNEFLRQNPIGAHVEILFNRGESIETIYSGEIYEVQYTGDWGKIKVKYHFDGEVREYTGKKFKLLKEECEEHKRKLGIEAKLIGRLNTSRIGYRSQDSNDWRYHHPDGTPVE